MKLKIKEKRKSNDIPKLDFATEFFLSFVKVKKVSHPKVETVDKKRRMFPRECNHDEVYIFNSFEEYRNFYLMYLEDIENDLIKIPIITRGNKGQIVALRGLINRIIIRRNIIDFYKKFNETKIYEIHERGNITPEELYEYWNSKEICPPMNYYSILEKKRCDFFDNNCAECRREMCTYHEEYIPSEEYKKLKLSK